MSRFWGSKEITARYLGQFVISTAYKGLQLIWQIVKSCFGGGFWNNKSPWNNGDGWKNQ